MRLFITRHGKTAWNEQNRVCGRTDIPLSKDGVLQAGALALAVAARKVDLIIASPLERAVETGRIVADFCHIPLMTDDRLIEQDYGVYEGVDRKNVDFLNNKRNFAFRYPEGESMLQVACRVYGLIDEIKEHYKSQNVLLISHGGVCRIIHTYFNDMTNDEFFNYVLANGKLEEYEL